MEPLTGPVIRLRGILRKVDNLLKLILHILIQTKTLKDISSLQIVINVEIALAVCFGLLVPNFKSPSPHHLTWESETPSCKVEHHVKKYDPVMQMTELTEHMTHKVQNIICSNN